MLSDRQFCVTITTAIALLSFAFFMRFLPDFVEWQGWVWCSLDACNIQGWLGALSGWFGGFAAFATIIFIMRQLREQRRQTDFSVGDALPTMDALEHLEDSSELVVRIVNWNRRGIVVRNLDIDGENTIALTNSLTIDGNAMAIDTIAFKPKTFSIKGWEDRSRAHHHAELRLAALTEVGPDLKFASSWRTIPRIFADVQILGDSHQITVLKADTGPIVS